MFRALHIGRVQSINYVATLNHVPYFPERLARSKATFMGVTIPSPRLEDRIAIFGGTGTGKSMLAQHLLQTLPLEWHKMVIDITDSIQEPKALTFYDPSKIPWDQAWELRFVPNINADLEDQINILYFNIFEHGACWTWLDEANEISTAHKTAFGLRKVLLQGRKAWVGHASCTPRPADISKSIVTQAQYLATFSLVDFDDRQRMARFIGMDLMEFDAMMRSLGPYEYLWYDVAHQSLYHVPALPKEEVANFLNPNYDVEIPKPESSVA